MNEPCPSGQAPGPAPANPTPKPALPLPAPDRPASRAWERFRANRAGFLSAWLLAGVLVLCAVWPWIAGYDPNRVSEAQFDVPSAAHWFGTDVHGRDLLGRVVYGTRISLLVGAVGAGVSLVIGVLWGAVAGYAGGRLDGLMMRFVDILYALPSIVFVIVLLTALNGMLETLDTSRWPGHTTKLLQLLGLFAGLGAVSWLTMARIVRGQVLSLRQRPFVDASRALGASHARILFRHILPNTFEIVIVYLALTVPAVILYESFLSYLGLGIQPPQASLGSLIAEGAAQINPIRIYWWILIFPAGTLAVILLALNFLGDALRDALDPRAGR